MREECGGENDKSMIGHKKGKGEEGVERRRGGNSKKRVDEWR